MTPEDTQKALNARVRKLSIVLGISIAFFIVEIAIGFKTGALALIADAFHYLNDIVSYVIALVATLLSRKGSGPPGYTFAYRRAEIVGAFFNASFLIALALSIFLQSIERFINVEDVDHPLWVMIVGCCGLALNIVSILVVHEHGHDHPSQEYPDEPLDLELSRIKALARPTNDMRGNIAPLNVDHSQHHHAQKNESAAKPARNLGLLGVLVHLLGDAVNNIGVIIAAAIMWKTTSPHRFYADPAVSLIISVLIFLGAVPLAKRSSRVLLEAAPKNINPDLVREDLMTIPGVVSVHELHLWHLTETDVLASFHVHVNVSDIEGWLPIEKELRSCFAAQGVTHVTISPEFDGIDKAGLLGSGGEHCDPTCSIVPS
ncbi:uncharacterized protein I206_103767 [Kwoniella pini CBS 10737]|uniref:Cation diffusion facilitator family transporter n=1 Tax=Kwoniella pini CBS 10737 TaxID=1296096 RepID=A0A1B9HSI1_9TREE|nr:uncharacterized protein I206_07716 [Kwoniella pini CBS 10737]OCF46239.1 hypothetical protein I206_07716 [Kwoniella pini CBS 10737]